MKIIKSKNFILRPAKLSDARNIYVFQQDKDTKRNFMSVPKSVSEVRRELRSKKSKSKIKGLSFVIESNGEAIGEISIWAFDKYNQTKAKISFWIAKKHRGKGIMTKAVELVTNFAFKKYRFIRIYGHVRTFNRASAKVMEKAGYKLEGILKKNNYKNGKYLDDMIWAKVR